MRANKPVVIAGAAIGGGALLYYLEHLFHVIHFVFQLAGFVSERDKSQLELSVTGPGVGVGQPASEPVDLLCAPLYLAASRGDSATVSSLLVTSEAIDVADMCPRNALMGAIEAGHLNVLHLLLAKGLDPNGHGDPPFPVTSLISRAVVVEGTGTEPGEPCTAAQRLAGECEGVEIQFEFEKVSALSWSSLRGRAEAVEVLLDAGADPDKEDGRGMRPLMYAAQAGQVRIVELLVAAGADVNAEDRSGASAMLKACGESHMAVVELLEEGGAYGACQQ